MEVFSDPCLVPREGKSHELAFKSLSIVDPTHFSSLRPSLSTYAHVLATCPFLHLLSARQGSPSSTSPSLSLAVFLRPILKSLFLEGFADHPFAGMGPLLPSNPTV